MKRATTLLAIVAVWAAVIAAPAAANDHVMWDDAEYDFFYESAEAELVLVTGPPFDQGCIGEGFTVTPRQSILIDGLYSSQMSASGVEMRLYSAPSFDVLINAACEALFTGGDMPQPIAFGIGSYKYMAENQAFLPYSPSDGTSVGAHETNSAWAMMTFEDGTHAQVRGNADYTWTDQGPNIALNEILIRPAG